MYLIIVHFYFGNEKQKCEFQTFQEQEGPGWKHTKSFLNNHDIAVCHG